MPAQFGKEEQRTPEETQPYQEAPARRLPLTVSEVKKGKSQPSFEKFFASKSDSSRTHRPEKRLPAGIKWGIGGIVAFFVLGFIVSFFFARHSIANSIALHATSLRMGIADLQNLDTQGAEQEFSSLGETSTLEDAFGQLSFLFRGGGNILGSFSDLSSQLTLLSQELNSLEGNVFNMFGPASSSTPQAGEPAGFAANINSLRSTVDAIDTDTDQLSAASSFLGTASLFGSNDYINLQSQLEETKTFLDAFAPWIATSTPHHILILLQNPSEIRPAGGFLGSYADLTIANGTIANVSVHDIADVDEGFTQNIVPPKPLQLEIRRFRPADANWFFDFPTSASETITYFQESSLYAASSTTFDGAIAISPKVVSDLLSITGPITVTSTAALDGNPAVTFTADNLLVQTQKLIQDGQAQSATYPKQVLRDLTSRIFTQLASSTDTQKQALFAMALDWIGKKDVMLYSTNPDFENFFMTEGAAGDAYQLPENFNGDYLAIADANVNGGKSDLYVSSTVSWTSQINMDGTISDSVIINREHNGNTSPYWWYRVTNQDYLQLFVPDDSSLINESGGVALKITPKINYVANDYSTDPLIASVESTDQSSFSYPAVTTHEESGKEVFSTWAIVKSGASTKISFDYTHQAFTPPADGVVYQFIFEKQAGTVRDYSFEIDAPIGYQFAENGLPTYQYTSDNPPGRMDINLTLKKTPIDSL